LPEVAGAIARRTGDSQAAQRAVADLLGLLGRGLVLDSFDEDLARESVRLAIDLGLRGSDAVYVAVASRRGLTVVTWDHEQRDRASRIVSAASPSDIYP
jgi:predicted nucleic acid-binding protein